MDKNTMLGRIISALVNVPTEMLGTLFDLVNRLSGEKGQETLINLKHLLRGEFEIVGIKLINWIDTTTTTATTEKFVAKNKFRKDSEEVKFHGFYGTFEKDFLAGDGKIEDLLEVQELRFGDLLKLARDLPKEEGDSAIIPELGGEVQAETTLTEFYDRLKEQPNGEEGDLLTNGCANIFYIKNTSGVLRAVLAYWVDGGWGVGAFSVKRPSVWDAGGRVFSRNS